MAELDYFKRVADLQESGETFATARIVRIRGSVPQRLGASLILRSEDRDEGTVGGGPFEAAVTADLRTLLGAGRLALEVREYALTESGLAMKCEGTASVLLEVHKPATELVIFGGGHVGAALVRLAAEVGGFRISVVDDRAEFASPARHPLAWRTIHTDELYREHLPPLTSSSYVVLVTHGHDLDQELCGRLAPLDLAYLGMIASKPKSRAILTELEEQGVPRERLERVHTPIGLDLGRTKTPGQVALSILAEVVKVRNAAAARGA